MRKKTALIVGAGPAGLTAAYELLKKTDIKPIIVEQNDFIGGISATLKHNGNRIDMGGHRFFSKSKIVMNWWQKILPLQGKPSKDDVFLHRKNRLSRMKNAPNPEKDDSVMLIRSRTSRIFYLKHFFDYPISLNFRTIKNLGFKKMVKCGFSYLKALIYKRREKSLEDFFINRFGAELYETFFKDYTEKLWGVKCVDIAPDWGRQRVKGLSVLKVLMNVLKIGKKETSLIESFWYPKFGPGQLWEEVAKQVKNQGGSILMKSCVTKIKMDGNRVLSVIINHKKEIKCDYLISSMPIRDLIRSMPKVPKEVKQVANGLVYRDFRTVGVLLNKMKLGYSLNENIMNGLTKDTWIYVQENEVKLGRVQLFNNWSPYLVKDWKNKVWIGLEYFCNEQDKLWKMTDADFISFAVDEAEKIGLIDKKDVVDTVSFKVPKAYPAYFGTYPSFGLIRNYLDTLSNLYVVGRNGMHRYNNMDHSVLSAMAVVQDIIKPSKNRESIWNINTEQEYHETK